MADPDSLYHQVKALIDLRKQHKALQNTAKIRFLDTEEYPLVYERYCEEERMLVIINPSAKACVISTPNTPGELIYRVGGSAKAEGNAVHVDAATAVFMKY